MTPEDITRLRALAEAVRDAGAVMRAAREYSDHALTAASADEYRKSAEAFRAAQKRLYADAPPDGIILALLDEFAMAYTRALQAAAGVVLSRKAAEPYMNAWDEGFAFVYERAAADILALTPEDIERITQEHEHG